MQKNTKNEKKPQAELGNSAQGLLRRLSNRYDANRVQAEKSAMKKLDSKAETDLGAPDVQKYMATTEVPTISRKKVKKSDADAGEISDEELKLLFEKYLGTDNTAPEPAGYDHIHRMILDAEKRAGVHSAPKIDVEKNIDEAEKYINSIAGKGDVSIPEQTDGELTGSFDLRIESAEQLAAFEPNDILPEPEESVSETVYVEDEELTEPQAPTDTMMMKAFGLDPSPNDVTKEAKILQEYSLVETVDLESTEDISAMEKEDVLPEPEETPVSETHHGFEYVDFKQNNRIFSIFRTKYTYAKVRVIAAAVLMLSLFLLENIPAVKELFADKMLYIAVDWFFAFAAAVLIFDRLGYSLRLLLKFKFDTDTITLFSLAFSLAATIVSLLTISEGEMPMLYNFPFTVCVFLNTISVFYALRRDIYSFKIISAEKVKRVVTPLDGEEENVAEMSVFSDFLEGGGAQICGLKKADFISDYFSHRRDFSDAKHPLRVFIPLCALLSVGLFFCSLFVMEESASVSAGVAYASFLMGVPFASFLSYSYPLFLASRRAYSYNCAILSDKTPEIYKDAAVITFRDEEAFPVGKTKVKSIKLYADRKIDHVIYYASSVYGKIGGPLASVFKKAALNSVNSDDVVIREIADGGVCAMVDGKNIVIGRASYMEEQCFETMPEAGDEEYEGESNKRIFYLACDQIVVAKFYVQYSTTSDFVYISHHLAARDIGTSIRTADPCIDDGILYPNKMNPTRYPVKIVKDGLLPEDRVETISARRGGIVSIGSVKEIVKTFLLCDKLENVKRTNLVLKLVACVLGFAVMALVLFTGKASEMNSVFPALYQLFWLLPIYFVSKIYI